jgi:hypothetical protein
MEPIIAGVPRSRQNAPAVGAASGEDTRTQPVDDGAIVSEAHEGEGVAAGRSRALPVRPERSARR